MKSDETKECFGEFSTDLRLEKHQKLMYTNFSIYVTLCFRYYVSFIESKHN